MAMTQPSRPEPRRPGFFWSRLHFLLRFLGLTGFLVACVGLVLAGLGGLLASWSAARDAVRAAFGGNAALGTWLVLGGAAAALLAVLVEALVFARVAAGRRSAFGFNALCQVALATVLFAGLNVWSFDHFLKLDWTRGEQFTLPDGIRQDLQRLDPSTKTLVVIYQRHKLFGNLRDKPPDDYDNAAERMVEEKVKDLVDQFRDFGPQFQVEVLDVTRHGYGEQRQRVIRESAWYKVTDAALRALREAGAPEGVLAKLAPGTKKDFAPREKFLEELARVLAPDELARWQESVLEQSRDAALAEAVENAPENTIFFYSGGRVQALSFNEFFLLDRVASQQANGGRGNLVLLAQGVPRSGVPFSGRGVEPFARKVLNLEERKPRVGVLVVHDWLTTQGPIEPFTLSGLRKDLESHGFEVRDVVLKRGWFTPGRQIEPAADSFEERKLDNLESDRDYYAEGVQTLEAAVKQAAEVVADWTLGPGEKESEKLDFLSKKYARVLRGRRLTAQMRAAQAADFEQQMAALREGLAEVSRRRDQARDELAKLPIDDLREAARMTDVKAKLDRALADCDLLLLLRYTRQPNGSLAAPNSLHRLSEAQIASIKEYLQAGKPALFCLGPVNEDPEFGTPDTGGPDGLESLLAELGVRLNKQTVLFDEDARAFGGERRINLLRADKAVKPPPLDFESPTAAGRSAWARSQPEADPLPPNRVREGLRVLAHSIGGGLDLRIRFPRPVSCEAPKGKTIAADPIFLLTAKDAWNDEQPFVTDKRRPHYEPPKLDDPANGTFDEKRRGAFPVGIAVEVPLPDGWSSDPASKVRLAVLGQGDVFVGPKFPPADEPAREQLFLQTANWLLGRDDALPRGEHPWSFPRVDLAPGSREAQLWLWGTRLGLPVLFAYLGLVVLLVRRLR
jgi:hypothetical protein